MDHLSEGDVNCILHVKNISATLNLFHVCWSWTSPCESSFPWQPIEKIPAVVNVFSSASSPHCIWFVIWCVLSEGDLFWTSALWSLFKSCKNILVSSLSKFTLHFLRQEEAVRQRMMQKKSMWWWRDLSSNKVETRRGGRGSNAREPPSVSGSKKKRGQICRIQYDFVNFKSDK